MLKYIIEGYRVLLAIAIALQDDSFLTTTLKETIV